MRRKVTLESKFLILTYERTAGALPFWSAPAVLSYTVKWIPKNEVDDPLTSVDEL